MLYNGTDQLRARIEEVIHDAMSEQAEDARDAGRSDTDIVAQTEALASYLLSWRWGQAPEQSDAQMRNSANHKAQVCWRAACEIQELSANMSWLSWQQH